MPVLTAPGVGSNLDVKSIVSQLMAVESRPLAILNRKEAGIQAKLSAFGTLKSVLSSFKSALSALSDPAKFGALKASSSEATVFTVSTSGTTQTASGRYSVEVSQLAAAQKLVSSGQSSTSAAIGVGTISFDLGTISGGTFTAYNSATDTGGTYSSSTFTSAANGVKTVLIDSTNNSLAGIRDAINKANIGVSASIVNNGGTSPYRLTLSVANSGKANSVKISVSGDAALSTLVAHNPAATQNLKETASAKDAQFTVDGLLITKSSNLVADVIDGVSLQLLKTNVGTPATLVVERDVAAAANSVQNFAKSYNDLQATLRELSAYDAKTKQAALLQGEATLRSIEAKLRATFNTSVAGVSGANNALAHIGVSFDKEGKLKVDSTKLTNAINTDINNVTGLFAKIGVPSDTLIKYDSSSSAAKAGVYALTVSQLATQGKAVGSVAADTTIVAGVDDTLSLSIDGVSATVTLTAGVYTAATLVTELKSKINGVSALVSAGVSVDVTESAGVLTLSSKRYGSASTVNLSGGNAQTGLFGTPTAINGVDTAGTIGGYAATGSGQNLTAASGDATGLKVLITGGATGDRGQISYARGYADQLDKAADELLSNTGLLSARTTGLDASIKDIGKQRESITLRLQETEKRLLKQFSSLDTLISGLQRTGNFLTQQLSNLPKIGR